MAEQILDDRTLSRYADAIVAAGVALKRRDLLALVGQHAHRELLVALAEAAYRRGARHVDAEIEDPLVQAARFRYGGKSAIGERAPWEVSRARALMREDAALVYVAGEGDPGAFDGIPPKLLAYLRWNPLYPAYAALEQIFNGHFPSKGYLLGAAAWAVGFFLLGAIVFLARERDFAVRL